MLQFAGPATDKVIEFEGFTIPQASAGLSTLGSQVLTYLEFVMGVDVSEMTLENLGDFVELKEEGKSHMRFAFKKK